MTSKEEQPCKKKKKKKKRKRRVLRQRCLVALDGQIENWVFGDRFSCDLTKNDKNAEILFLCLLLQRSALEARRRFFNSTDSPKPDKCEPPPNQRSRLKTNISHDCAVIPSASRIRSVGLRQKTQTRFWQKENETMVPFHPLAPCASVLEGSKMQDPVQCSPGRQLALECGKRVRLRSTCGESQIDGAWVTDLWRVLAQWWHGHVS